MHNIQFVISYNQPNLNFISNKIVLGDYFLSFSNDLNVSMCDTESYLTILIGEIFDYENTKSNNSEILSYIGNQKSFNEILTASYKYSGVYLIFVFDKINSTLKVFTDFAAQHELFYTETSKGIIAASSHELICEEEPLIVDNDPEAIAFFKSKVFKKRLTFVGEDTNFRNLKRLKPNHYLDFTTKKTLRYFPDHPLEKTTLSQVVDKGSKMIQGYMEAASSRKQLLIPVTAGWDSRLLLAASKKSASYSKYFILKDETNTVNYDVDIPNKLLTQLGFDFHIIKTSPATKEEIIKYKKIANKKLLFPRYQYLKNDDNPFFQMNRDSYIINGNISEVARLEFDDIYKITPEKIAFLQKYPNYKYAINRYEKWLNVNNELFKRNDLRVLDMLYWEENCANWAVKRKSENNLMGVRTYSPFNSRELIILLLGLPKKYRRKQNPVIYKKMIMALWPEVLNVPVNPSFKKKVIQILQKIGVYGLYRNIMLWFKVEFKRKML